MYASFRECRFVALTAARAEQLPNWLREFATRRTNMVALSKASAFD
jgi:hypothetical protein